MARNRFVDAVEDGCCRSKQRRAWRDNVPADRTARPCMLDQSLETKQDSNVLEADQVRDAPNMYQSCAAAVAMLDCEGEISDKSTCSEAIKHPKPTGASSQRSASLVMTRCGVRPGLHQRLGIAMLHVLTPQNNRLFKNRLNEDRFEIRVTGEGGLRAHLGSRVIRKRRGRSNRDRHPTLCCSPPLSY